MGAKGETSEAVKAMIRLDTAARQGLEPALLDLVKIRASQINHCAFCLDMHSKDALAIGESTERQGDRGDRADRAVTVLTDGFVPAEVYARAANEFDETELARLVVAITTINAWNRFGVSTRLASQFLIPLPERLRALSPGTLVLALQQSGERRLVSPPGRPTDSSAPSPPNSATSTSTSLSPSPRSSSSSSSSKAPLARQREGTISASSRGRRRRPHRTAPHV
jgi:AhpD family alkylhydroperoxidase